MRKFLLILFAIIVGTYAYADNFPYLTFETSDGAKTSIASDGLEINISGNTLTIGQKSFTISNLSKMYFSASDETSGLMDVYVPASAEYIEIYDLKGNKVPKDRMKEGIYLIRDKNGTYKIAVK